MSARTYVVAESDGCPRLWLCHHGTWYECKRQAVEFFSLRSAERAIGQHPPVGYRSRTVLAEVAPECTCPQCCDQSQKDGIQ